MSEGEEGATVKREEWPSFPWLQSVEATFSEGADVDAHLWAEVMARLIVATGDS